MWLQGRSPHTHRTYRSDTTRFLAFVSKPLHAIALRDVQASCSAAAGCYVGSRFHLQDVTRQVDYELDVRSHRCRRPL